jgi:hypothetical protein
VSTGLGRWLIAANASTGSAGVLVNKFPVVFSFVCSQISDAIADVSGDIKEFPVQAEAFLGRLKRSVLYQRHGAFTVDSSSAGISSPCTDR